MPVLNIYRNNTIIASPEIDEGTKLVRRIMNAQRVTANFVANEVLPLELGDYVTVQGENYYLNQLPTVDKTNENSYKYVVVFQSILYNLYKKMLISSDGLTDFSYTGTAEDMLLLIISNINQIEIGWSVGNVDDTEIKTIQFANESCRTALTLIASTFNLEFYLNGKTVYLEEAIGTIRDLTFKYGQNSGLYNIIRKPVESKSLVTRLYAYGATKNLPYTYRDHAKRLVFEERYLEKNETVYGIQEGYYTNDDIFPNRTATLTAVSDSFGDGEGHVTDASLDFNINDYITETRPKIVFKSGELSGYEFEVWKYDHDTKSIYFNPLKEGDGFEIPSETNMPAIGDKYTLVNINMPPIYIIEAEDALKAAAQKYLDSNCTPKSLYLVKLDHKFVKTNAITLDAGDLVKIEDAYLGIDQAIRVNQITFPLVNPNKIEAVIADFIPYSLQEQITKVTSNINRTINNINNTVTNNTRVVNNNTTVNGGEVNKIKINGQEFWWEKAFDNSGADLEPNDVIYGNYWNRYIFVKKWTFLGGIKELRESWDEIETIDETPEP
ncbi:phage tail protein [Tamlana sp. I1]|uniref:phage tail protein n=1 Tax=Tamlana sp. I1 TaxID=2762061 RepID=UPI00188F7372|nr:phage tail protein [Tamlana sp. I1]